MNKELPKVEIIDQEFPKSWQPANGWLGIIPGISTLEETTAQFGKANTNWQIANGTCYLFANETIQVLILDSEKQSIIAHMRILPGCSLENAIPDTFAEAEKIFGNFKQISEEEDCTVICERPGVRVARELFGESPKIKWIEFYPVQQN